MLEFEALNCNCINHPYSVAFYTSKRVLSCYWEVLSHFFEIGNAWKTVINPCFSETIIWFFFHFLDKNGMQKVGFIRFICVKWSKFIAWLNRFSNFQFWRFYGASHHWWFHTDSTIESHTWASLLKTNFVLFPLMRRHLC